jgi:hypothetical protein
MVFHPQDDRPDRLEDVPDEEDISEADAAERLKLDPEKQRNYTEDESVRDARTDAGSEQDLDAPEHDEA